ncbi:probable protein S-acyltransferase 16 [Phoenix dactylifera]|uniref:S-acyltransferase n=1 Tax=Phoenix dactylifera TaxID=42345 RepID=A0A8B9ACM8_PHODC|nr:probable protein S-acyltransferase 16 [Phoenix dactylifera]
MSRQGYITLPIFVVLATVAFLYYSTVFLVIDEWMGLRTAAGLGNAVVFTFLTLMAVGNYCIAVFRDPGRVPPSFMPDVEEAENPIHEIKRKGGDLRFCQKCSHYKPPRTHHCRVCKRCVLRMDHHCVWINNCVGHENYKVFIIFVLYGVIACIHSMVLFVGNFIHDAQKDQPQSSYSNKTTCIIGGALLFPLTLALSVLLGWQIYLILQNKTTIEYHEGVRAMWLEEKVGNMYRHPYDLGVYENLVSVLGPNIFCWLCPVSKFKGSGLRFPTAFDLPISTTLT